MGGSLVAKFAGKEENTHFGGKIANQLLSLRAGGL